MGVVQQSDRLAHANQYCGETMGMGVSPVFLFLFLSLFETAAKKRQPNNKSSSNTKHFVDVPKAAIAIYLCVCGCVCV